MANCKRDRKEKRRSSHHHNNLNKALAASESAIRRPTRQRSTLPPQTGAPIPKRLGRRCAGAFPPDFDLAAEHAPRGNERRIAKDSAWGVGGAGAARARGEMHEKERKGRRMCGVEAVARKGGFRNEERDGWRRGVRGCHCGGGGGGGGLGWAARGRVSRHMGRRRVECVGVSVNDALELAQVCGAHLPFFGFALGEDA